MIRGEREALLARREFLQQLSLWEEDIRIPLPGCDNLDDLDNGGDDHDEYAEDDDDGATLTLGRRH